MAKEIKLREPLEDLDALRKEGDPLADNLINSIMKESNSREIIGYIFRYLQHNRSHETLVENLPEVHKSTIEKNITLKKRLCDFLKLTSELPSWKDDKKMAAANEVFEKWMPEIMHLLLVCSLPLSYAGEKGAKVLKYTGRLLIDPKDTDQAAQLANAKKRVSETSFLIIHTLCKGGLDDSNQNAGIATIQKVRLAHALIRFHAKSAKPPILENEEVAVNQEDMLGTLMGFGIVVIKALEELYKYALGWKYFKDGQINLADPLRKKEIKKLKGKRDDYRESYLHAWNVIGYLLGVNEEYLPEKNLIQDPYHDSWYTLIGILKHQALTDVTDDVTAGKELTSSLLKIIHEFVPKKYQNQQPYIISRLLSESSAWIGFTETADDDKNHFTGLSKRLGLKLKEEGRSKMIFDFWSKFVTAKGRNTNLGAITSFQEYFIDLVNIPGVPVPEGKNDEA